MNNDLKEMIDRFNAIKEHLTYAKETIESLLLFIDNLNINLENGTEDNIYDDELENAQRLFNELYGVFNASVFENGGGQ